MLVQGQTQEDGEPAPGSARPLHRADVHIIEPSGSEIWIDVHIHTAHVDQPIGRDLLREKQQKCQAYGQTNSYNINRLDQGIILVVLEQHGRTAQGPKPSFSDCYTIARKHLSDKGSRRTPPLNARLAQSYGHNWRASCSEQPGNLLLNVSPLQPRPGCRIAPNRPGRISLGRGQPKSFRYPLGHLRFLESNIRIPTAIATPSQDQDSQKQRIRNQRRKIIRGKAACNSGVAESGGEII